MNAISHFNIFKLLIVGMVAAIMSSIFVFIGLNSISSYVYLTDESQGVEILTALFYIIAGLTLVFSSLISIPEKRYYVILPILLGIFFIFIGGEEESWGQWIFEFTTPEELAIHNSQDEVNIHNLNSFSGLLNPHFVLNMFVLCFGIITPILYTYSYYIKALLDKINCPVSSIYLVPFFMIALLYEKIAIYFTPVEYTEFLWRHTEVMEFLFSCGFIAFAFFFLKEKNGKTSIFQWAGTFTFISIGILSFITGNVPVLD